MLLSIDNVAGNIQSKICLSRRPPVAVQRDMKIIKYGSDEEDVVRRLLTALVSQWDELPPAVQDLLLRKACLGFNPTSATTSLREQIKVFIQKHGTATGKKA